MRLQARLHLASRGTKFHLIEKPIKEVVWNLLRRIVVSSGEEQATSAVQLAHAELAGGIVARDGLMDDHDRFPIRMGAVMPYRKHRDSKPRRTVDDSLIDHMLIQNGVPARTIRSEQGSCVPDK